MKILQFLASVATRYFGVIILLFSGLAFVVPEVFVWATQYIAIFLAVAMFGMGLTISAEDFKVVFTRPKDVLFGCLAQYIVMPTLAWGLCMLFALPPDLAIGVILVGCCPGGTASNVITYIAKGDEALSVGMTIVSTLFSPIVTPLLTYMLAGAWVEVSFTAMFLSVIEVILLPVFVGLLIHNYIGGERMKRAVTVVPVISVVAIVFIIASIISNNLDKILSCGLLILVVVALHNVLGMICGLILCKILKTNYEKTTAIAIEIGMQNSGLAVSLAVSNFAVNPLATLPGAIFSVWHNISGCCFATIRSTKCKEIT